MLHLHNMKHLRIVTAFFILTPSLLFTQTNFVNALDKCPGEPAAINWSSTNISNCTLTPSNNNPLCGFGASNARPNGTDPINLPSGSCTSTLSCGNATPASDSLTINPGQQRCCGNWGLTSQTNWNASTHTCLAPCSNGLDVSTYSTCTCPAGQTISGGTCVVAGTPSVTVTLNPTSILSTGSSQFSWTSSNTSYCNVTHPDGLNSWLNAPTSYGPMTVSGVDFPNGVTATVTCFNSAGASAFQTVALGINGACSSPATHYSCSSGTSANNTAVSASSWTWNCNGLNGGSNASCSETAGVSTVSKSVTVTVSTVAACTNGADNPTGIPPCTHCPASLIWNTNTTSCVLPFSITVNPAIYSATLPNHTITATYALTNANSSNATCRLLDNTGTPLTSYASCTGNMSITVPNAASTYLYSFQAFKSQTGETKTSNTFTVTVLPVPPCSNGANNPDSGCNICTSPQIFNGVSCVTPLTCSLPWGGSISNTEYRTAYRESSVTSPTSCASEVRTCSNGILSGSYTNQNCTQLIPGCMLPGANNYNPLATVSDGSCCYGWTSWNGNACVTPSSQVTTLIAEPRTSTLGVSSVLSWDVKFPSASCTLSATTICANGSCVAGSPEITAQNTLNAAIQNGNTDANDPYGASRPMSSAIKTISPISTTDALGKKTLQINYTTDFLLQCGESSRKVRFLITTNNEG